MWCWSRCRNQQFKLFKGSLLQYKAVFQKLCKHSWYLTEENVVFVFSCSAAVSNETKQKIADQLRSMPHPDEFRRSIPIFRQKINENANTGYLIGPDFWLKFKALYLEHNWLYQPAGPQIRVGQGGESSPGSKLAPPEVFWIVIYFIMFSVFLPPFKIFLLHHGMISSCGTANLWLNGVHQNLTKKSNFCKLNESH